jgi:plasmid stability protein
VDYACNDDSQFPEETHRALKERAILHGKSTEAEVRAILEEAVRPKEQVGLGTALHEFAMQFGGFELDLDEIRGKSAARAANSE